MGNGLILNSGRSSNYSARSGKCPAAFLSAAESRIPNVAGLQHLTIITRKQKEWLRVKKIIPRKISMSLLSGLLEFLELDSFFLPTIKAGVGCFVLTSLESIFLHSSFLATKSGFNF